MSVLLEIGSDSIGDVLSVTPVLRKLYNSYQEKIDVATYRPNVLKNNPCINTILNRNDLDGHQAGSGHTLTEDYKSSYDHVHAVSSWNIFKPKDDNIREKEIVMKHNMIDLRRYHALCLGFDLHAEEMHCDFYPDPFQEINLFDDYICIHPSETWQSRTWEKSKWNKLLENLVKSKKNVVIIGKTETNIEPGQWGGSKPMHSLSIPKSYSSQVLDLTNKADLSQTWHILDKASCVITMDTGILHLAGTTDVEIIQLGSSIDYKLRAPYRNGTQAYKYKYIGGACGIACASDPKYSLKVHGSIQSMPPLWKCLETYEANREPDMKEFKCHPEPNQVLEALGIEVESDTNMKEMKFPTRTWQKEFGMENEFTMNFPSSSKTDWVDFLWDEIIRRRTYERFYEIQEGDIVFDLGANLGFFSTTCSQRNIGHCYSFEPMPNNFSCLKKNISLLKDSEKFTLINKAISDKEKLYVPANIDQHSPHTESNYSDNSTVLNCVKLSDFAKTNKIDKIDFLKLDIEGGEYNIFEDESEFDWVLENCDHIAGELHLESFNGNRGRFKVEYLKKIISKGFDLAMESVDGVNIRDKILNDKCLNSDPNKRAHDHYDQIIFWADKRKNTINKPIVRSDFVEGAYCGVVSEPNSEYTMYFIDARKNSVIHTSEVASNDGYVKAWSKPNAKHFVDWKIIVKEKYTNEIVHENNLNLKGENVLIIFESRTLGDTIAWIPYVEEFRKKHNCNVFCKTFHNDFLKDFFPFVKFASHNEIVDHYASYKIGWFGDWTDKNLNPDDPREIPLQQTASGILGLEHQEIRPRLDKKDRPRNIEEKYICISIASTAGLKHWQNESGWQQTVDYLNELGYKVVVVQKEFLGWMDTPSLKNVIHPEAASLDEAASWVQHCEFFIGLGSGVSWLAWALNKKVILISGFSKEFAEFETPYRVQNLEVCNGCWNDANHKFDKGDWNWCPKDKNFECSKSITFEMVKEKIDQILKI